MSSDLQGISSVDMKGTGATMTRDRSSSMAETVLGMNTAVENNNASDSNM